MKTSKILEFLKELAANNNRDWFNDHKSEYDEVREMFENFIQQVILNLSQIEPSVLHLTPKECTYRIYRDIRFSADKTPYKTHIGGYINPFGKKSNHCGYYIHLQPGSCFIGGGSLCPPPRLLKSVREHIYDNIEDYIDIVESPSFKQYFKTIGMNFLKGAPKGFPKDFPYLKYLQNKEYIVEYPIDDQFFERPDSMEQMMEIFKEMKRLWDFVNPIIDNFETENLNI